MRRSELARAVAAEFGEARGSSLLSDLALGELDGRTCDEALAAGADTRVVWLALCRAMDVPDHRQYGAGRLDPHER